jgi:putative transposase
MRVVEHAFYYRRMERSFRYRFYPTPTQTAELIRTFGCVRKVYNTGLQVRSEAWKQRRERVGYEATSALLTVWKQSDDLAFLAEVSSVPLQQALRHLNAGFNNFFSGRARYPRFKSRKKSRRSAEYTRSAFRFDNGRLTLAKMTEALDIVWSRPLPDGTTPSTVTVTQDPAGRWFVSLCCSVPAPEAPVTGRAVGIDVGLSSLLTLSDGTRLENPRHEKRERTRLSSANRSLSRKEKGSKNRAKAQLKLARIHARLADRRHDSWHQITTRLVRENQTLVIKDLAIGNLLKNHRLARAISDASWRIFRDMLTSKAEAYGRTLLTVPRWYPSTRLCSACGARAGKFTLAVRVWTCADCRTHHDRDVNAARNILAAGPAVSACGVDVRPQRGTTSRAGDRQRSRKHSGATQWNPLLSAGRGQGDPRDKDPGHARCDRPLSGDTMESSVHHQ